LLSVRGRDRLRFLHLHFFVAAFEFAFAGLGAERLGAAYGTLISFTQLTRHFKTSCGVRLFLLLHRLAAAYYYPGSALGDNHLGAALGAAVSFAYLVCHRLPPLYGSLP
jgi:hypothetical protein